MSEPQDKDSKTEQATEKKLVDAREDGNVPVSKEVTNLAYLLGGLAVFSFMATSAFSNLGLLLANLVEQGGAIHLNNEADAVQLFGVLASAAIVATGPIVVAFALAGIGASVAQNLPRPVLSRITPDLSRISLGKGFMRLVGASNLLEFGKTIFRFIAVVATAIVCTYLVWDEFQSALFSEPDLILWRAQASVILIFALLALASIVLMIADLPLVHGLWKKELRMAPHEVKDEHKQAEGDPRLKSRRMAIGRQRAKTRMMLGVSRATLVVANPTHFAVALRYVRTEGGAPRVVAKGQDLIALAIRHAAEERNIPVIEDKALARSLYAKVDVDQMIPNEFYKAIAEILISLNASKPRQMRRA